MLTKKLVLLAGSALTLTTASAAFADHRDYRDGWRHRQYHDRVVVRPVYVAPRPVYYYEPAPVYYAPAPTYYAPAPVYYSGAATVGGALAGAIIGNQFGHGDSRVAATAVGAILGAAVGSQYD